MRHASQHVAALTFSLVMSRHDAVCVCVRAEEQEEMGGVEKEEE